jgi:hypothetical protein
MSTRNRVPDRFTSVRGEESDAKQFFDWITELDESHRQMGEFWLAAHAAERSPQAVCGAALHSLQVSADHHAETLMRPFAVVSGILNVWDAEVKDDLQGPLVELHKACKLVAEAARTCIPSEGLETRYIDANRVARSRVLLAKKLLIAAAIERGWKLVAAREGPLVEGIFFHDGKERRFPPLQWRLLKSLFGKARVPVEDVMDEVYPEEGEATDGKFRKLLSDTTYRLQIEYNLPYSISRPMTGYLALLKNVT